VSVLNLEKLFMSFDPATSSLSFDPNSIPDNLLGTSKKLEIQLKDDAGAIRTYYITVIIPLKKQVFSFDVQNLEANETQEEKQPEFAPVTYTIVEENCTATIESITALGEMKIRFNTSMITTVNLTELNSTVLDMYIIPALERHQENAFNISKLNFTFNATDFRDDLLTM
jgi:hypothetical protein